uniref:Uncharacterized protein n=1 Tax=Tetranychus urticae TaxID=32264 RepID=T1K7Y2_TETUR
MFRTIWLEFFRSWLHCAVQLKLWSNDPIIFAK